MGWSGGCKAVRWAVQGLAKAAWGMVRRQKGVGRAVSAGVGRNEPSAPGRARFWWPLGPQGPSQPPGGPWARARMLRRAATNTVYEGWPPLRLMISVLAWRTTRPGRLMTPKRTAFSLLLTHS